MTTWKERNKKSWYLRAAQDLVDRYPQRREFSSSQSDELQLARNTLPPCFQVLAFANLCCLESFSGTVLVRSQISPTRFSRKSLSVGAPQADRP